MSVAGVIMALATTLACQRPGSVDIARTRAGSTVHGRSPFALLPGFKIERVTPADKTESLIVVTFDSLGRPVVSQSSSGNGSSPRLLLDENGDGIFEGEKIVSDKLNTCHGLFYAGRTLYANCRGVVPAILRPTRAPAAPPKAAAAAIRGRRSGSASPGSTSSKTPTAMT